MNEGSRISGLCLLIAAVLLVSGCEPGVVKGNGRPATESRELTAFSTAVIHGDFAVTAQQGLPPKAELTFDSNLLKHIRTTVAGNALQLQPALELRSRRPGEVRLVSPTLESVTHVGHGPVTLKLTDADVFLVAVKNTGSVSGSGSVNKLTIHSEGSGHVDLRELNARVASVIVTGDADVTFTATATAAIEHHGTGTVTVFGSPKDVDNKNLGEGRVLIK
ncbi:MAG: DUF2807 domain-containing protein [Candidatus Omnitrophica bacterium]|nr:DUF2807 domain-containing protein [Candidatus Omnitrophota bacterium]MCB9721623.1 DUF2807 domain-containing protein [Candidatus Omnitrophota bacterium]